MVPSLVQLQKANPEQFDAIIKLGKPLHLDLGLIFDRAQDSDTE